MTSPPTSPPNGVTFTSKVEFETQIVRSWLLCDNPSVFGTHEDGLEIRREGRWSKLRLADGRLHREHGWDREGTWTVLPIDLGDGSTAYQLDLRIDGSGTVITSPQFAASRRKIGLSNIGVFNASYVETSRPVSDAPRPDATAGDLASICRADEGGEASITTHEAFAERLIGSWVNCDPSSASIFGTAHEGLELRADGSWSKLDRDTSGALARQSGPGNEGLWEVLSHPPDWYQVNFMPAGGGVISAAPVFAVRVPKMRLRASSAGDYVRAETL